MSTTWAYVTNGLVAEIIAIGAGLVPGVDVFTPAFAAGMIDVTSATPQPEVGWTYNGKKFSAPVAPAPTSADLTAYAASRRYDVETGGYVFEGHPISTDRDSQSKIASVAVAATIVGSAFSTDWKCSDGSFFTLDHDGALAMATAIMTFVSSCFAAEASLVAGVAAGTIKTTAAIDAATWPANS